MAQDPKPNNRFSFTADLQSRDGGVTKDARVHNAFVEVEGGEPRIWQRPALGSGVLGTGSSQGLIAVNGSMYEAAGGTLYRLQTAFGTTGITLTTGTSTMNMGVVLGTNLLRFDFTNAFVYSTPQTNPVAFTTLGTTTNLASGQPTLAWVTEWNPYVLYHVANSGVYDVYASTDGFATSTTVTAFSGFGAPVPRVVAIGAVAYSLQNPALNSTYQAVVNITTGAITGTYTSAFGSFSMIGNPIWGSAQNYIWAMGTATWTGGTSIIAIRGTGNSSGAPFVWNLVGTLPIGTGIFPNTIQARLGLSGSNVIVSVGTTGTATYLGMSPTGVVTTLATGVVGTGVNYGALLAGTNNYVMGPRVTGVLSVRTEASSTSLTSTPGGMTPRGFGRSRSGTYLVMQGTSGARLYNLTNGTSGNITGVNFPSAMVPGLVFLDDTYYVMESDGTIWNSTAAADDPTTWPTDGFITAQFEPDDGVALTKALNYVIAMGQWTVEMFWDAGNPTGSPLLPVNNGVLTIGCASASSIAQTESTIIWIAQRKGQGSTSQKGRFIAMLVGTSYEELSTSSVSRILDNDDLATVYSSIVELGGHTWYILGLGTSNLTLVFDMKVKKWYTWSRLAVGTPVSVSSLTQTNGYATAVAAAHGFSDGDPVVVSGASAGFNGTLNVSVSTSTAFSYPVSLSGTSTSTGTISAQGFTESYFDVVSVAGVGNVQYVQDSTGSVYTFSLGTYTDAGGIPLNIKLRTNNLDGGNAERKFCFAVAVVGDILASTQYGLLRYTDDDFQSYSYYRRFDLSENPLHETRFGYYVKRAWEWRYTGTSQHRLQYLEPEITQGVT